VVEAHEQNHKQLVSFEVLYRTSTAVFKRDKVFATGKFSVSL